MKAIVYTQYGPPEVLRLQEVPKPTPKADEVLVRVHAAALNMYDYHLVTADIFLVRLQMGLLTPKHPIPGADIAGEVEAVGAAVTQFQPGQAVYGDISARGNGGLAEYVCVPEKWLAPKPAALSSEAAAAVPMAAVTALQGLRDLGQLQPGQHVLIQGAAGGVGTFAVQIAKALGAEVTAVCSPRNLEQARALGADRVIDYTREDFTQRGERYDVILGVNGYHPLSAYQQALAPRGRYVMAGGTGRQMFEALVFAGLRSKPDGQRLSVLTAQPRQGDLLYLNHLLETGRVVPVIDRRFPLAQTAEALRYLGQRHARGKVVVNIH